MKSLKNKRPKVHHLTEENIKEYPKHVQEAFAFMSKDESFYLTPKYYNALWTLKEGKLNAMFKEKPELPLKDVAAKIIGELPEFIPADKILELTGFVLNKWQELKAKEMETA